MIRRLLTVVGAIFLALLFRRLPLQTVIVRRAEAAPEQIASANGCVADWYVSYSGTGSWTLLNTDPDNLPLSALRFSRSYNDPTDLSHGYLDFNRDGKSDIFSAVPMGSSGLYQWRYSSGGASPWINLAIDTTPPDQLQFGDFNGDGYTDVFSTVPLNNGDYQWQYSSRGNSNYANLAYDDTPPDQLRFGDFNGDGRTDVFALKPGAGADLNWMVSYSGTLSYMQINHQTTPLSEMQFGDIDGNGHTDVFTTLPDAGSFDWIYSPNGSGHYQTLVNSRAQSVHDVLLAGNFDGSSDIVLYHGTDIFYTTPRLFDGTFQWWYFFYKPGPLTLGDKPLAYADTQPSQLRFADFNGDGVTDVFKLVQRCNVYLPTIIK